MWIHFQHVKSFYYSHGKVYSLQVFQIVSACITFKYALVYTNLNTLATFSTNVHETSFVPEWITLHLSAVTCGYNDNVFLSRYIPGCFELVSTTQTCVRRMTPSPLGRIGYPSTVQSKPRVSKAPQTLITQVRRCFQNPLHACLQITVSILQEQEMGRKTE